MSGELTLNGKPLTKKNKQFMRLVSCFVIKKVALGESLSNLPLNSETLPPLFEIFEYIDNSTELSEMMSKAENSRLQDIKEKMIRASQIYAQTPSAENRDVYLALEKTYTNLSKSQKDSGSVVINYSTPFPQEFWDNPPDWEINEDGSVRQEAIDDS